VKTINKERESGLYPRGYVWWVRFSHNGQQLRFSTEETDEAKAIVKARELKASIPILDKRGVKVLVKQYLADRKAEDISAKYLQFTIEPVMNRFAEVFAGRSVFAITGPMIQKHLDGLKVAVNTREAYRFQYEKFYVWLINQKRARHNPAKDVKFKTEVRSTRKNWVRLSQINEIIDNCDDLELKYILFCGFHAGLRKEEVIMSRPEWFDFETGEYGVMHVPFAADWRPKDRTERTVPLSPEFRKFLDEQYYSPGPYMIAPKKMKGKAERYRHDFRTKFETFVAKQKSKFTFHDTRRSFASNLVNAGVPIWEVGELLGDDVEVVVRSYAHLDPNKNSVAKVFNRGALAASTTKPKPPTRPENIIEFSAA
jgi:integrase